MSREYADVLMHRLLSEDGFDFDSPSPQLAWECFQRFLQQSIPDVTTQSASFECCQASDRDDVIWFSLMRHVTEPDQSGWSCGCLLARPSPPELMGTQEQRTWWPEQESFESWVEWIEDRRSFVGCVRLDGWAWEGFSE
jgi:hypothetical protein